MATFGGRIGALEVRVQDLETWAGPGQASVLAAGLQAVRGDLAILRRSQESMLRVQQALQSDVAELKADVAELKADVAELKETLREVLRRLPPPAAAS